MLTVAEVAQRLKVHESTIYTLCANAQLKCSRIGRGPKQPIRIALADLLAYQDQGRTPTPVEQPQFRHLTIRPPKEDA